MPWSPVLGDDRWFSPLQTREAHDPVPDGKSGPWLRQPHARTETGAHAHDPRCAACRTKAAMR